MPRRERPPSATRESKLELRGAPSFSFEAYLATLTSDAEAWTAIQNEVQDAAARELFARFCSWGELLFPLFGVTAETPSRSTTKETSLEGVGFAAAEETRYRTRFETSTASYEVTLARMFNGHMGYSEDWLSASFVHAARSLHFDLDLFEGGPVTMTSDGLSAETHDAVRGALDDSMSPR